LHIDTSSEDVLLHAMEIYRMSGDMAAHIINLNPFWR